MARFNYANFPDDQAISTLVSQKPQLLYLATARKDLVQLVEAIEASKKDNGALNGLVQDVSNVMVMLATWAGGSKSTSTPDVDQSVKELISSIEIALEFAKRQLSRHWLLKIVFMRTSYTQNIEECRTRLQNTTERFMISSHIQIQHSQTTDIRSITDQVTSRLRNIAQKDEVLQGLRGRCALGASHNSSARRGVKKCLEGTRLSVIHDILSWFNELENPRRILWVHSPAGYGKTTIAQTIADILAEQGRLGASFFWPEAVSTFSSPVAQDRFVMTIAYQFCLSIPGFFECAASALQSDIRLVSANNIYSKMERLVVQPLTELYQNKRDSHVVASPWLLLIDGIDEYEDYESQEIIRSLMEILKIISFPLRLLFCSRDDWVIKSTLKFGHLFADVAPNMISLLDASDTEADIGTVFKSRFQDIKEQHAGWAPCLNDGPIPENLNNWPTQDALDTLVWKSQGLFIYADAAMGYIEDPYSHPIENLQNILSKDDLSFEKLDQLYSRVLLNIPESFSGDIKAILNWLVFGKDNVKSKTICDTLFGFDPDHSTILLSYFASVIHVPFSEHGILEKKSLRILHTSFSDFLQDRLRLQRYNVEFFHCVETLGRGPYITSSV